MQESGNQSYKKVAVVMAGGFGVRLWPRSTEKIPKQYIHLLDEGTMIQNTVSRLLGLFPIEDIYIVTLGYLKDVVKEQLPDLPEENIILEPFSRNTAPCLALALVKLMSKYGPNTIMSAFPSDHVIYNKGEFYYSLETAFRAASELDGLITIGIQPTRPETGFGYVQVKKDGAGELGELYNLGLRKSTTFAEKPDVDTARRFIESGDFLWNSGIFIWKFGTFWDTIDHFMPEDAAMFKILSEQAGSETFNKNLEYTYRQISSESIDYAIMEKAKNVYVVQSTFRWSDMGNWDELYRISMKDARNNVIEGDVIPINISNCFVSSNGRLIGIVGVNDLIVVDSPDSLLICRRQNSEDVKEIVDFMRRKQINKF